MGTEIKSPLSETTSPPLIPSPFFLDFSYFCYLGNSGLYEVEVYLLHFF